MNGFDVSVSYKVSGTFEVDVDNIISDLEDYVTYNLINCFHDTTEFEMRVFNIVKEQISSATSSDAFDRLDYDTVEELTIDEEFDFLIKDFYKEILETVIHNLGTTIEYSSSNYRLDLLNNINGALLNAKLLLEQYND
jgi:hypothetical protein